MLNIQFVVGAGIASRYGSGSIKKLYGSLGLWLRNTAIYYKKNRSLFKNP
jgi:hypothetical protein